MKSILRSNELFAFCCQTCYLQAAFNGFGTAVDKKAVLQLTGSNLGKSLRQISHRTVEQHLAAHRHSMQLFFHSLDNFRMTMT